MKIKKRLIGFIVLMLIATNLGAVNVCAMENKYNQDTRKIILEQLELSEDDLSEEETYALFSVGTVWNETYTNEGNIKKNLSMVASLITTGNTPYTRITVKNTGSNTIIINAYKGAVFGSDTIAALTLAPGRTGTMTITKNDVINYGTMNGQGDHVSLGYTVSIFGADAENISCTVYAAKYE